MTVDISGAGWRVFAGSCLDRLRELPDESVDAVVTDPPYGLSNTDPGHVSDALVRWVSGERDFIPDGKGFMGKAWDAFVPPPAVWDECLRVLKPGGHVLAFAGSRTFDLMALSIRLAGFEIRDSVAWLYGSGFPKSLDVSKAIDKSQGENRDRQLQFTAWMRLSGLSSAKARHVLFEAGLITEKSNQASHYFAETMGSQPAIATADMFDALRPYLPEVPEEIERLVAERTGIEWTAYKNREVVGSQIQGKLAVAPGQDNDRGAVELDITAPATREAQKWQGWGTALKPAFEPVVVARKPLGGRTVAENVLLHGTGGLNIDGTRIGTGTGETNRVSYPDNTGGNYGQDSEAYSDRRVTREVKDQGRWPSNVMLDEFTAGLVDEQSGVSQSGKTGVTRQATSYNTHTYGEGIGKIAGQSRGDFGDSGGASRFFFVSDSQKHDRMTRCENIHANSVAKLFSTIRATIESSAQTNVEDYPNELSAQIVKNAGIRCDSCATHIAADLVVLKTLATNAETSTHFQAFIRDSANSTLNQNLALVVAKWVNTGIIPTMTDCLTLFGCALLAIDERIKPESLENDKGQSSFIYRAKASRRDRNEGLDELPEVRHSDREKDDGVGGDNPRNRSNASRSNFHPTVKPTDLMRQLVRLVTPPGGVVLDPFTGSGSTGKAAILEGFEFIGVELTNEYLPIIEGRLSHAVEQRAQAEADAVMAEAETLF